MRAWGFLPSPEELDAVVIAMKTLRDIWSSRQVPFPAPFDGSIADVHALDYMNYEGAGFPLIKLEVAALVCGEVLRRAAGLEWVISYRGEWFVATCEDQWPSVAICPLARFHESECGFHEGHGMYYWFVQRAAFDCLGVISSENVLAVQELLKDNPPYLERIVKTLEGLSSSISSGHRQ